MIKVGKVKIGKECSARWFPGIGHGYWDGWQSAFQINLKFRTFEKGFAIGPLMIWW